MELPDKSAPQTSSAPKKKVEQVVTGAVLVKRPASRRFKDFIMAESPKVVLARIGRDLLWPRAKAAVEEGIQSFVAGMFWPEGENRPMGNVVRGTVLRSGAVNYNGISTPSPMQQAMVANVSRPSGNYQDVVCPSQQVAEHLLANMFELLNQYRMVAVADLYEAAGLPTTPSDSSFGWSSLDGARISKVREGFLLELPRPSII